MVVDVNFYYCFLGDHAYTSYCGNAVWFGEAKPSRMLRRRPSPVFLFRQDGENLEKE
jgi:hypothetical protein